MMRVDEGAVCPLTRTEAVFIGRGSRSQFAGEAGIASLASDTNDLMALLRQLLGDCPADAFAGSCNKKSTLRHGMSLPLVFLQTMQYGLTHLGR